MSFNWTLSASDANERINKDEITVGAKLDNYLSFVTPTNKLARCTLEIDNPTAGQCKNYSMFKSKRTNAPAYREAKLKNWQTGPVTC